MSSWRKGRGAPAATSICVRTRSTPVIAEGALRLAARGARRRADLRLGGDQPHTLAAAAGRGLEHYREPDLHRCGDDLFFAVERPLRTGNDRHLGGDHALAGLDFVAH